MTPASCTCAARYSSLRMRAIARPVLATLRVLEGPR